MPIQVKGIPERGHQEWVDLTESDAGYAYSKPLSVARVALIPGAQNAFCFNWQNPESVGIIVVQLVIRLTAAAGAAATLDAGTAAATATHSDNLIDGQGINITGLLDSMTNRAGNGRVSQYMAENGGAADWVCGQILTANALSLAGYAYIWYIPVE